MIVALLLGVLVVSCTDLAAQEAWSVVAKHTLLSQKTIRRYVRAGILRPRREVMGGGFRYVFTGDDIDRALMARDQKAKKLELFSPALAHHLKHKPGKSRTWPGVGLEPLLARCPRCRYSFTTGAW